MANQIHAFIENMEASDDRAQLLERLADDKGASLNLDQFKRIKDPWTEIWPNPITVIDDVEDNVGRLLS